MLELLVNYLPRLKTEISTQKLLHSNHTVIFQNRYSLTFMDGYHSHKKQKKTIKKS